MVVRNSWSMAAEEKVRTITAEEKVWTITAGRKVGESAV